MKSRLLACAALTALSLTFSGFAGASMRLQYSCHGYDK
jgi:hypothetical protein